MTSPLNILKFKKLYSKISVRGFIIKLISCYQMAAFKFSFFLTDRFIKRKTNIACIYLYQLLLIFLKNHLIYCLIQYRFFQFYSPIGKFKYLSKEIYTRSDDRICVNIKLLLIFFQKKY